MGVWTWNGRGGVAVRASRQHVNIVRLHAKRARGGQLGEVGPVLSCGYSGNFKLAVADPKNRHQRVFARNIRIGK